MLREEVEEPKTMAEQQNGSGAPDEPENERVVKVTAPEGKAGRKRLQVPAGVADLFHIPYLGLPGILKIPEIVLAFLCYICSLSARHPKSFSDGQHSWSELTAWSGALVQFLLLLAHLTLPQLRSNNPTSRALAVIESIFCAASGFFFFISGCLMASVAANIKYYSVLHGRWTGDGLLLIPSHEAKMAGAAFSCIFAFLLVPILLLDAFFIFKKSLSGNESGPPERSSEDFNSA